MSLWGRIQGFFASSAKNDEKVLERINKAINMEATELDLSNQGLTSLPPEIGQLTHLSKLNLAWNKLHTLPPRIGQLTDLASFDLRGNQLRSLPPEIAELSHLTDLDLWNNQLTTLPSKIGQLSQLTTLTLSNNYLSELPAEIGQLSRLKKLSVGRNRLSKLPAEIGQLTNLTTLLLYHNQLRRLPPQLKQLTNLTTLDLRHNSELTLSVETLKRIHQPAVIMDRYLRQPLNEVKLILVGQGGVGKTSLVKWLTGQTFDQKEETTYGINIKKWSVSSHNEKIQVNMWDFGGQEIMRATHQFFLSERALYLLVLDARQGEKSSRLAYWLNLIQSFGDDSPIIVVTNKIDQYELELYQDELKSKYLTIKAFVKTSCQSEQGLDELKEQLISTIKQMAHVSDPIPAMWRDVKEQLARIGKDYIGYENYVRLCEEHDIHDEKEQRALIRLLHDLGVLLNFDDVPELKETVVLNPEWLTGGIYTILTAEQLAKNKGFLEIEQLDEILDPRTYPKQKHLFLMDMMRKFEFCFDLEGHVEEQYLLPDLLPMQQPKFDLSSDRFTLEIHYDFLPSSVMSRFIVRLHRFIFQDTCWRNGVLLVHNKNRALVKAVPDKNKILISITGKPEGRRAFWAIIHQQFKQIHTTIKSLNAKVKVPVPGYRGELIDYSRLLHLQQQGTEKYPLFSGDQVVEVNVAQLLGQIQPIPTPVEPKEVLAWKSLLGRLRARVHPQKYYNLAFQLGELYYKELVDYTLARQALMDAHEALEGLRGMVQKGTSQVAWSKQSAKLYQMLVDCYLVEEDSVKAFEYAAVGKGRAFVNTLAKSRFDLSSVKSQKSFTNKLAAVRQKRHEIQNLETQRSVDEEGRRAQQDLLLSEEAILWRDMARDYPVLTATLSVPTLSEQQAKALADKLDATLVEYYQHTSQSGSKWCAFVVTASEIQHVPLPKLNGELLERMENWRNNVHLLSGRTLVRQRRLTALYEAAVAPLRLKLERVRVIIAPFAELHLLPLSAAYDSENESYFAQQHTLSYVPSLTALHVLNQEHKPAESSTNTFKQLLSVAYPGSQDNYLPNVIEEAEAIANRLVNIATVERLHKQDATPDNVVARASDYDVIHFGCHGHFDSDNPTASGLRLAERTLTIEEIITKLDLKRTHLATLAACLTGQVRLREGEEHIGLLQAMMTAGVQTVVTSLWYVDDAATRALFEAFYARQAILNAPAEAMQDACNLLRDIAAQEIVAWKHPFYWAAFQVNGLVFHSASSTANQEQWPPADLLSQMSDYAQRSTRQRGERSQLMNDQEIIDNAEVLFEDLFDYPDEVLAAFQRYPLSAEVAQQEFTADEVGIARAIYLIVQNNPALPDFLPVEEDMGLLKVLRVTHAQHQKAKQEAEGNETPQDNSVSDFHNHLIKALQQKRPVEKQSSIIQKIKEWFL